MLQVRCPIWPTEFIGDLVLGNCCPFEGGGVGQLMRWQTECVMMVVFRSWSLAVQILVRERLGALCEEFEVPNRQQASDLRNHEKAPVEGAVPQLLWSRDRAEREMVGHLRLALRELRREEEEQRKRLLPPGWKRFRAEEIKEVVMERSVPVGGPDGKTKVKEALIRDLLCGRGHLHDSKTLTTVLAVVGTSREERSVESCLECGNQEADGPGKRLGQYAPN